jgi:hypothetical protein
VQEADHWASVRFFFRGFLIFSNAFTSFTALTKCCSTVQPIIATSGCNAKEKPSPESTELGFGTSVHGFP